MYRVDQLNIGKGGNTPLCPFDCDCCYSLVCWSNNVLGAYFRHLFLRLSLHIPIIQCGAGLSRVQQDGQRDLQEE